MKYDCPVCDYPELTEDPARRNFNICPQCGVEFGVEPQEDYPEIRAAWIAAGRPRWMSTPRPWPWLE